MIRKMLLWSSLCLSTALSAGFFFSLGDGLVSGLFLAALGIVFEGSKAYSWKTIGAGKIRYLWLGVPCTILSLGASIGYASLTLEQGWSEAEHQTLAQGSRSTKIESLSKEYNAILGLIEKLPPGWTSSALRLSERLDSIRTLQGSEVEATGRPVTQPTNRLAFSLGRRFAIDTPLVVTLFLFAIATVLEVGIVVLVLDQEVPQSNERSGRTDGGSEREVETEAEKFLKVALNSDGTLAGRRKLVEMGWSEKQVREIVMSLVRAGTLSYSGRGKPIRLANTCLERKLDGSR